MEAAPQLDGRGAPHNAATRWRHASGKWVRPLGSATSLAPISSRTPGAPISGSAWPAAVEPYARAGAALCGRRSCVCVLLPAPIPNLAPALPCFLLLGDLRPGAITEWESRDHLPLDQPLSLRRHLPADTQPSSAGGCCVLCRAAPFLSVRVPTVASAPCSTDRTVGPLGLHEMASNMCKKFTQWRNCAASLDKRPLRVQ